MEVIWCWRIFLIIAVLTTTTTSQDPVQSVHCNSCIRVNTTCYHLEYLFNLTGNFRNNIVIHSLGLLRKDNTLFYAYEPEISDPEYLKVGFVDLPNGTTPGVLSSPTQTFNFGAFDIDQENGVVYLGGSLGVYQLDTNIHKLTPFSSRFDTIVALFYRNGNIYFVQDGEGKIVSKQGDSFIPLIESSSPVKKFVITNDGFVVYTCSAGFMVAKDKEVFMLSSNPFLRGLSIDLDGVVYAWWVDGIYKVVLANILKESKVVKVADISTIGAMTFDNSNNILFTSDNAVYRLSPTNIQKC